MLSNSVEITNIIVGGVVSVILMYIKTQNDKQTKAVAEILKVNTAEQSNQATELKATLESNSKAIDTTKEELKKVNEAMKIVADTLTMDVSTQNMVINTRAHDKYKELLDADRKKAHRIAELTKDPADILVAKMADEAYNHE